MRAEIRPAVVAVALTGCAITVSYGKTMLVGNRHQAQAAQAGPSADRVLTRHPVAESRPETSGAAESSALRRYMMMPGYEYLCTSFMIVGRI